MQSSGKQKQGDGDRSQSNEELLTGSELRKLSAVHDHAPLPENRTCAKHAGCNANKTGAASQTYPVMRETQGSPEHSSSLGEEEETFPEVMSRLEQVGRRMLGQGVSEMACLYKGLK